MVTLHFFNSTINVKIRTNICNIPADGLQSFSIEMVEGNIDTAEKALFDQYKIGTQIYTLGDMRKFATDNGLQLNIVEDSFSNSMSKLGTPAGFAATVNSATQITLNWTVVPNSGGYILQRSTNSGFTANLVTNYLAPSKNSQVVTGLVTATHYYFRLKAIGNEYLDGDFATDDKTTS